VAGLLSEIGRGDEAIALLDPPGSRNELMTLAELLIRQGSVAEAMDRVHSRRAEQPVATSRGWGSQGTPP
jgi:hypothetical protein